jgi:hypothetical protein
MTVHNSHESSFLPFVEKISYILWLYKRPHCPKILKKNCIFTFSSFTYIYLSFLSLFRLSLPLFSLSLFFLILFLSSLPSNYPFTFLTLLVLFLIFHFFSLLFPLSLPSSHLYSFYYTLFSSLRLTVYRKIFWVYFNWNSMMLCTGGSIACLPCKPVSTSFCCSLTVGLVGNFLERYSAMRG